MRYSSIKDAIFLARPNRFVAQVLLDGQELTVHVKNTGRCKELLIPGTRVLLSKGENPARRTPYDLVSVYKGDTLINMDSQAPNAIAKEFLLNRCPQILSLRQEQVYGSSRFDFAGETNHGPFFLEIKGVTLERNGIAYFPDAPTERGVKHLHELMRAVAEGHRATVFFVLQMAGMTDFAPNDDTHPAFGAALRQAAEAGVHVAAYGCRVTPDTLELDRPVPVIL